MIVCQCYNNIWHAGKYWESFTVNIITEVFNMINNAAGAKQKTSTMYITTKYLQPILSGTFSVTLKNRPLKTITKKMCEYKKEPVSIN